MVAPSGLPSGGADAERHAEPGVGPGPPGVAKAPVHTGDSDVPRRLEVKAGVQHGEERRARPHRRAPRSVHRRARGVRGAHAAAPAPATAAPSFFQDSEPRRAPHFLTNASFRTRGDALPSVLGKGVCPLRRLIGSVTAGLVVVMIPARGGRRLVWLPSGRGNGHSGRRRPGPGRAPGSTAARGSSVAVSSGLLARTGPVRKGGAAQEPGSRAGTRAQRALPL